MDDNQQMQLVSEIIKHIRAERVTANMSGDELYELIEDVADRFINDPYCLSATRAAIVDQVYSSFRGLGILDSILNDDTITEVMINGPSNVFIEQNGKIRRSEKTFEDLNEPDEKKRREDADKELYKIIQQIVGDAGREVSTSSPIVDTSLEDGSRVNIVMPPIALDGYTMTIRKFSKTPMTIEMLIKYGSLTEEIAAKLELLVRAKYNIFVSGGTGSGKTTFLNALSNFIPKDERIITIEDSAELQITGIDNLVRMQTRNANSSGEGQLSIRDLIKSSLRMRPDRIIVGEVRGEEALDMLQAMNTGHDGSLSTGHANSTEDMLSRLETMVLQGAAQLPLEAIKRQIASAVDIIIHLSRLRDKSRKTMAISEVLKDENGFVKLNTLYEFREDENTTREKVSGSLVRTDRPMVNTEKLMLAGIHEVI